MTFGEKTFALPLGSPPLLACYRGDLIDARGGDPPRTLAQRRQLVEGSPAALATTGDAAAHLLILRSLSYIETARRTDALFNPEDMAQRIDSPPFERALTELVGESLGKTADRPLDMVQAVELVRNGSAGATLGWPGIAAAPADASKVQALRFAAPPPADEEYSVLQSTWQKQTLPEPVAYLGVAGRLVGVCRQTRNAVSAFQFCTWLSASERVSEISARSHATLWFRPSQARARRPWTGGLESRGDDDQSAEAVAQALSAESPFIVPRVPGIDEYLAALGDAVRASASGAETPAAALKSAAAKFEQITESHGRQTQLQAYRRHLGLEPAAP
jgi:ABC-type glycerol-3-phosphate transport system substrate-binding protein